jgi:hypothetical protein
MFLAKSDKYWKILGKNEFLAKFQNLNSPNLFTNITIFTFNIEVIQLKDTKFVLLVKMFNLTFDKLTVVKNKSVKLFLLILFLIKTEILPNFVNFSYSCTPFFGGGGMPCSCADTLPGRRVGYSGEHDN